MLMTRVSMGMIVLGRLSEGSLKALDERFEFSRRKPCFGVKCNVVRGRHFAVLDHLGCIFAVLLSAPPL